MIRGRRATVLLLALALGALVAVAADEAAARATLQWTSKADDGLYGYLVYRSERRQGPFLRINPEIIHLTGPADDETTNDYVYQDTTAQPGTTYFYYLDTISKEGHKNRFSGVLKKTAPPNSTTHPDAE